jgi:hypothetical protein
MPRRRHFRRTWLRIYSLWSLLFRSIRKCGDFIARHYLTLADSGAGLRRALWLLRGPLLVVTIFVAMLQTDQLEEVLWIHAADLYDAPYRPLLGWSASILYFFVCNACAGVLPHPTALSRPGPYGFSTRRHLRWLVLGLPLAPVVGLSISYWNASVPDEVLKPARVPEIAHVQTILRLFAAWYAATALFLYLSKRRSAYFRLAPHVWRHYSQPSAAKVVLGTVLICLLVLIFPIFWTSMGALAVLLLWAGILTYWASLCTYGFLVTRIPMLGILGGMAVLCSYFDLNDDHRFRTLPSTSDSRPPDLTTAFDAWLEKRQDRSPGTKYPVFLISAQGGGLYAAYNTAVVLARLQDRCPAFAQHIFAVSSVSGGSLGAAVFAALSRSRAGNTRNPSPCSELDGEVPESAADDNKAKRGSFEIATKRILEHDFLSPLIAGALFPDFLQQFVPFKVPVFDRARALEYAWEEAWRAGTTESKDEQSLFGSSFRQLWDPTKSSPALFLNTTVVETGGRMIIAPVRLREQTAAPSSILDLAEDMDMPLSTAAGLSARFPYVTPAGFFEARAPFDETVKVKIRLGDGGYFENSGVATAFDLYMNLDEHIRERSKEVVLYLIQIGSPIGVPRASDRFGELLSPLKTMLKTREARGEAAVSQVSYLNRLGALGASGDDANNRFFEFSLDSRQLKLPLGWDLSMTSRARISRSSGYAEACRDDESVLDEPIDRDYTDNDCVTRDIQRALSPSSTH